MRKIASFFLLLLFTISLFSCSDKNEIKAKNSELLLFEAEELFTLREFDGAEKLILEAVAKLDDVVKAAPEDVDYRLLRARAYFLLFQSKNILTLENAPQRPRSLVRIAEASSYVGYDSTIPSAESDLKAALNTREEFSKEEEAITRGMLAAVYRLTPFTASKADTQYLKAIEATRSWLMELEKPQEERKKKRFAIKNAQEMLVSLQMSRVEVNLLLEKWPTALSVLESIMGGRDLKYFSLQFNLLENKISSILKRLEENKEYAKESRAGKLLDFIKRSRKTKNSQGKEVSSTLNTLETELLQTEEILTTVKNNLIYRVICYYHLGQKENLRRANQILKSYYPNIATRLSTALER